MTVVVVLLVNVVVADSTVDVLVEVVIGVGDDAEGGIDGLSLGERFFAWKLRMLRGRNKALRGTIGACCGQEKNENK